MKRTLTSLAAAITLQAQHLQRPAPATLPMANRMGMPGPGVVVRTPHPEPKRG